MNIYDFVMKLSKVTNVTIKDRELAKNSETTTENNVTLMELYTELNSGIWESLEDELLIEVMILV